MSLNFKKLLTISSIIIAGSLCSGSLMASPDFGFDFTFFGTKNDVDFKTHSTLFWDFSAVQAGAVFQYEKGYDMIIGGGLRLGKDYFLEFDGGYLKRQSGLTGFGFIIQPGKNFGLGGGFQFRVSVPVVIKSFSGASEVEYSPYIGFLFNF
jgi:hypothetical protein